MNIGEDTFSLYFILVLKLSAQGIKRKIITCDKFFIFKIWHITRFANDILHTDPKSFCFLFFLGGKLSLKRTEAQLNYITLLFFFQLWWFRKWKYKLFMLKMKMYYNWRTRKNISLVKTRVFYYGRSKSEKIIMFLIFLALFS